jgi:hypothetical protein
MKWTLTDDQAFRVLGTIVILLGLPFSSPCGGPHKGQTAAPFDGQVAEWTKRTGQNSCDYGHFSPTERTLHKWSAACPQLVAAKITKL